MKKPGFESNGTQKSASIVAVLSAPNINALGGIVCLHRRDVFNKANVLKSIGGAVCILPYSSSSNPFISR